jgi:hypothetical protein
VCRHRGGTGGCRHKLRLADRQGKVSDGPEQPHLAELGHPNQRLVLHGIEPAPRALPGNDLGLVQPDHALGQRVIVRIAHAADGEYGAHLGRPRGVLQRNILRPMIRVDQQPSGAGSVLQGLLQRIEHQAGVHRPLRPPAHDAVREHVDHEGHVDEAYPGRDIHEVRHPELVRTRRGELPLDQVGRLSR